MHKEDMGDPSGKAELYLRGAKDPFSGGKEPDTIRLAQDAARQATKDGEFDVAVHILENACGGRMNNRVVSSEVGMLALKMGEAEKYEDALELLQKYREELCQERCAKTVEAIIYYANKNVPLAIALLQKYQGLLNDEQIDRCAGNILIQDHDEEYLGILVDCFGGDDVINNRPCMKIMKQALSSKGKIEASAESTGQQILDLLRQQSK